MTRHTSSTAVTSASSLNHVNREKCNNFPQSEATTYSRLSSVKGYDRTRIARLSVEEYRKELANEALQPHEQEQSVHTESLFHKEIESTSSVSTPMKCDGVPSSGGSPRSAVRHKKSLLLHGSRFPFHTTFSSKYPVYDRLGHELCVLYQMQEVDVASEVHRIRRTPQGRQTGVRVSTELVVHTTRESQEGHHTEKEHTEGGDDARSESQDSSPDQVERQRSEKRRKAEPPPTINTIAEEEEEPFCAPFHDEITDGSEVVEGRHEASYFSLASRVHSRPSLSPASRSCSHYRLPSVFSIFKESPSGRESPVPMRNGSLQRSPSRDCSSDTLAVEKTIVFSNDTARSDVREERTACLASSSSSAVASSFPPEPQRRKKTGPMEVLLPERCEDARRSPAAPLLARLSSSAVVPRLSTSQDTPYPYPIAIRPMWGHSSAMEVTTAITEAGIPASSVEDGILLHRIATAVEKNFKAAWMAMMERRPAPRHRAMAHCRTGEATSWGGLEHIAADAIRRPCTRPAPLPPLAAAAAIPDAPRATPESDGPAPLHGLETEEEEAAHGASPSSPFSSPATLLPPPLSRGLPLGTGAILPLAHGTQWYRLADVLSHEARLAHGLAKGNVWSATPLFPVLDTEGEDSVRGGVDHLEEEASPHSSSATSPTDPVVHLLYPWRSSVASTADGAEGPIETYRCGVGLAVCAGSHEVDVRGCLLRVKADGAAPPLREGSGARPTEAEMVPRPIDGVDDGGEAHEKDARGPPTPFAPLSPPPEGRSVPPTMGITILSLPPHFQALPVSVLSLSGRAFHELFRLTLQTASALLSKRLLHGRLEHLEHLWIAFPMRDTDASKGSAGVVGAPPTSADGETARPGGAEKNKRARDGSAGDRCSPPSLSGSSCAPFLLPLHWERCVDFRMFSDRRVGKEIPILWDVEDGTDRANAIATPLWHERKIKADREGHGAGDEAEKKRKEVPEREKEEEGPSRLATALPTPISYPCTTSSPLRYSSDLHVLLNEMLAMRESRELNGDVFYAARDLLSRTSNPSVPLSVLLQLNALLQSLSLSSCRPSSRVRQRSPTLSSSPSITTSPTVCDASAAIPSFPTEAEGEWDALCEACCQAWSRWSAAKAKNSTTQEGGATA